MRIDNSKACYETSMVWTETASVITGLGMFPLSSVYLLFLFIFLRLVILGREGGMGKKRKKKGSQ